jgi:hypothetical protein
MSILTVKNANYAACVVELSHFSELAGCDRLQAAIIFGNSVIVSKDVRAGDVGLFFPVETQLLRDFLANNNLYRKPEWGNVDPEKKGFFEEHGRVKAMKFRGHKSEGFWIPLESLSYLGLPLSEFPVGATFDTVGERPICKKYVPRFQSRVGSGPKTAKRQARVEDQIVDGQFQFHIDTENLRRNVHKITPDMWISISDKWHGCLSYSTRVLLPDFTWRTIGSIVKDNAVGLEVLGVDDNGNITPTQISRVWDNGETDEWLHISGTRTACGRGGTGVFAIFATPNHKFWSNGEYVPASQLREGDVVSTVRSSPELTPLQKSVLLGKMLGDGSLTVGNKTAQLEFGHKVEHGEYLQWTLGALGSLSASRVQAATSGHGTSMVRGRTVRLPGVYDYLHSFIGDSGVKSVPSWVGSALDPISIAFWYMDDGCLTHNSQQTQEDRAYFATCGFTEQDCRVLLDGLNKFGISGTYYVHDGRSRIRLGADDSERLFLLVAPYIPPCMQYKLPERYRGHSGWMPQGAAQEYKSILTEQRITKIERTTRPLGCTDKHRYDITTGTHNFFANGVLVHNSSAIFANVLVERPLKWWEKLLQKIGIQVSDVDYGYVWSSRRVVKGVNGEAKDNAVHYYSSDIWGTVAKEVEFAVPKGFTLYGEIVGYTEDGSAIQKGYHYGCQPKTHRFLVYRVTFTNDDGNTMELSWLQMKDFCAKYGLEMVKELWYGRAGDFGSDYLRDVARDGDVGFWQQRFLEELESTYVRDQMCEFNNLEVPAEGIVVRVESAYDCVAFKCKSFKFLEWETKQLDAGSVDIETAESEEEVVEEAT